MFPCSGRDRAEFTVKQKKGRGESLVCTKFKMESKLHSMVKKTNQGIWGLKEGK